MKARFGQWMVLLMMAPLMGVFAFEGCTASTMRIVAQTLEDQADDIDGGDKDFGEWLADEIEDW